MPLNFSSSFHTHRHLLYVQIVSYSVCFILLSFSNGFYTLKLYNMAQLLYFGYQIWGVLSQKVEHDCDTLAVDAWHFHCFFYAVVKDNFNQVSLISILIFSFENKWHHNGLLRYDLQKCVLTAQKNKSIDCWCQVPNFRCQLSLTVCTISRDRNIKYNLIHNIYLNSKDFTWSG